ncbi:ThuA domain-containing protein [Nonomuraea insulae]|uniref:ThuA domain-containing protein n=1 Tax=Nonomuraea insulae TaxID=1616787 RepID=A0ABW1CRS1_9ACTN
MRYFLGIVLALLMCVITPAAVTAEAAAYQVLVFSKTAGFRHDSIPAGVEAVRSLGAANGFTVTATEDAGAFTTANLANYRAVVFLSTTGDVLNDGQQAALQSYVDGGGGFAGVHAAADTEYGWPYYGQLVGAWFKSHPAIQQAVVRNEDRSHPATAHLGPTWTRTDEWYDYRTNPRPNVKVLQTLDESTYSGGTMGADHPITWYHSQGSGRSFYTGLGHTIESYSDGNFRQLLLGGIQYAAGVTATPSAIEGEAYTSGQGVQIANHTPASGGRTLGHIDNGDWAGYSQVNTANAKGFSARVSSGGAGGTVQIRSGSATGALLGTVAVPVTGGWESFQTVTTTLTGSASGPLFLVFTGGAGALFDIDTFTLSTAAAPVSPNVHVFYYPWYGSPSVNGAWRHWEQGGRTPPADIGADLYPKLGPYDSGDTAAIDQHMRWIRQSGAGVLVYSWWGRGGYEDNLARRVMDAAQREGIKVAWHIEPYANRTAASVVSDVQYLNQTYGTHPAFRNAFYVFESLKITDWTALDQVTGANVVLAQTTDTSKIAHFSGLYTYDAIAGATAPGWQQAAAYAKQHNLIWAPSIGPGYIDDRAVPGNTTPTLARENGAAYDRQWTNAINTAPNWVSITSFNEWHEGSVIEPAVARSGYQSFEGAYGKTGAAAETAYLDRTRYWVERFQPSIASAVASN